MLRRLDLFIDRTTMYRLVLYYVIVLALAGLVLAPFGLVPFGVLDLALSLVISLALSWSANWLFCKVYDTPANTDSVWITAIIVSLVMNPVPFTDWIGLGAIAAASLWAIASKFLIAVSRKHIFNPAALGVALAALLLDRPGLWWIATPWLLPIVVIGGLLIVRKLQRYDLVIIFVAANLVATALTVPFANLPMALSETLLHSPLLFLGFAMLTEPLTTPPARWSRLAYALLVGVLMTPTLKFGDYFATPELALLAGNLFAFLASPKRRHELTLVRIEEVATDAFDFVFRPDRKLRHQPGQYLEWTLETGRADARGNRRSFTIASSPTEDEVRLGVKINPGPSTFKKALQKMQPGDRIFASQLAGTFLLPKNPRTKIALIAGGIGVTPYRSMIRHLLDTGDKRDIVLLYGNNAVTDIAYRALFDEAKDAMGLKTIYAVAKDAPEGVHAGFIDEALIRREVPDFAERDFYLSGPRPMVLHFRPLLRAMGVPASRIKEDYFPGFA